MEETTLSFHNNTSDLPPSDQLDEVLSLDSIPLVDIQGLLWDSTRPEVIRQIGQACAEYGFFQIINHGIPDVVSNRMMEVAEEFFTMPVEDRMEYYSDDPLSKTRLSTSFNVHKDQVFNWRDYLRHHCYPLEDNVHTWPSKPAHYREVRALALRLLEAISESLGVEADFLDKALGKHEQHMAINYYPKCPNPELTFGLPAHSDPLSSLFYFRMRCQVYKCSIMDTGFLSTPFLILLLSTSAINYRF